MTRKLLVSSAATALLLAAAGCTSTNGTLSTTTPPTGTPLGQPVTPIKHVIVIFGENISYDHYFATYPSVAYSGANSADAGEIDQSNFPAAATAPANNNLLAPLNPSTWAPLASPTLLTANPNSAAGSGAAYNGAYATNPFLLWNNQAATADQNHSPRPEQIAYDNGAVDQFPGSTGNTSTVPTSNSSDIPADLSKGQVMGYFDGTTVTALWNYSQNFAMNDNTYTSQFGPSTPGAIIWSKNSRTRAGSAWEKRVVLVVTRKPRLTASLIASTAMSKVPSRQTAVSCSSLRPSMWTEKVKYVEGLKRSSLRLRSKALVQR